MNKLLLSSLLSFSLFYSCTDDGDVPVAPKFEKYDNGFFVVNEGTATNGTISFVTNDLSKVEQDIYTKTNPGDAGGIGKFVQSMFFNGDNAYIISNGSNKITVVNRHTFKLVTKIETGLTIPRYGVVANGKAYVTNANTFGFTNPTTGDTDDFVAVINLNTNRVEKTIPINDFAERITAINGTVYISGGAYGKGNKMYVVSATTDAVVKTLTFNNSPNSMFDNNGKLYVLCANSTNNSEINVINTTNNEIEKTIAFPATLKDAQNLSYDSAKFYFNIGSKIYDEDLVTTTTTAVSEEPLFTSTAASIYGFTAYKSKLFVAEVVTYTTNGNAFVYTTKGDLLKKVETELLPNGFYFNY